MKRNISALWDEGAPYVLDGALGTELERAGVDTSHPGWTSRAILEHPTKIVEIHRAYIEAGSDILTTNTFRTNPLAHRSTGLSAEALTRTAVQLAQQARAHSNNSHVKIAGSIAPAADCYRPEDVEDDEGLLRENHRLMATWLAQEGCDLILIETMNTFREAYVALKAAKEVTELPIIVSIVPRDPKHVLGGTPLELALETLVKAGADALSLNCQTLPVLAASISTLSTIAESAKVPWAIYPNASDRVHDLWVARAHEDHEFGAFAREAYDRGATIIGSCCGTTPMTTEVIATTLDELIHA